MSINDMISSKFHERLLVFVKLLMFSLGYTFAFSRFLKTACVLVPLYWNDVYDRSAGEKF